MRPKPICVSIADVSRKCIQTESSEMSQDPQESYPLRKCKEALNTYFTPEEQKQIVKEFAEKEAAKEKK